jgi:uncharacterized protein (TIGR03382 family)
MIRAMPRLVRLALPLFLLTPVVAHADETTHPFDPSFDKQLLGFNDFTFDTDWFPADAPLQLRLIVHAGNTVAIDMAGDGHYDWPSEQLHFEGHEQAGELAFDVGVELDAKVRFDVLGLKWESDIIGPYDYAVISAETFTPYLLPGNTDRPLEVMDQTDAVTFVSVDIVPDILVAHGHLDIDVFFIITGSLACVGIEATAVDPVPSFAAILNEGEAKPLDPGPGPLPDPFAIDATLHCDLSTAPTIVLNPVLIMEILGKEYQVAGIEIPIDVPAFKELISMGPEQLLFDRPEPVPEGSSGGESDSGDGSASDSDSGSGGATDTSASTGDTGANTDTDAATAGFGGADDDGCSCAQTSPTAPDALLALLLLPLRRRRRARR